MLDTKYNHLDVEKDKYENWKEKGYFKCGDTSKEPFTIILPPPNVTGKLHLGHAWDVSLQDIMARYKRMDGYDVLWLPGMDHAAIATEAKVVKKLKESGIDKSQFYDLFKEIQNEIKDKVITKYLHLLENQAKELNELRKENTLLKNQLTYILKRILLNKYDYTSVARNNRLNNLNSSINYNRSMIIKDNNRKSNSMLRPLRSCDNYRCVTENIASRYKESNNSTVNLHGSDNNSNNMDYKISGYLNSLYRHNYNNSNKPGGNQFLNKNQGLLEELFPNKNNSFYMDMDQYNGIDGVKKNSNKRDK